MRPHVDHKTENPGRLDKSLNLFIVSHSPRARCGDICVVGKAKGAEENDDAMSRFVRLHAPALSGT